ncbi:mechanosensitive ion channel domain-containing protein [Variovorax robiniae]|uniref:Small-conductance mechanosensitive channel n=1 Tax=Variovorax robiniae TaxID=1836199 RepID=A0ABU8XBB0_9BURK
MKSLASRFAALLALVLVFSAFGVCAQQPQPKEATVEAPLYVANRPVFVFRAPMFGLTAKQRAARAVERIDAVPSARLQEPVLVTEISQDGVHGYIITQQGATMFAVFPADLEPGDPPLQKVAAEAGARLQAALLVRWEAGGGRRLAVGIAWTVLASVILSAVLMALRRGAREVEAWTRGMRARAAARSMFDWRRMLVQLLMHLVQWVRLALVLVALYLWLAFVLTRFPYTQPWGATLGESLRELVARVLLAVLNSLPDVAMIAVIVVLARIGVKVLHALFEGARASGAALPALQPDTIGATKRLSSGMVWIFALVMAYPFIPGSDSDAFKGLSVLFGVLVTLSSSGVVSQIMAGFVLVYSRALRPGDQVRIGDEEGQVLSLGVFSTKLRNRLEQEVTLPNAVVVAAKVVNYTQTGKPAEMSISTTVTIGYDTPWRQVQAMLVMAAGRTAGLLPTPVPVVRQVRLQDWYIEYELNVFMRPEALKYDVLHELHSHIVDVFNEYGVQLMSPNYVLQPADAVLVPKDGWRPPPAV